MHVLFLHILLLPTEESGAERAPALPSRPSLIPEQAYYYGGEFEKYIVRKTSDYPLLRVKTIMGREGRKNFHSFENLKGFPHPPIFL